MPRIKLKPLEKYQFQTEITVRTTDLNYGGHLGNDSLLSLIHEARVAFLAKHRFSELNCAGVSLIMADSAIVYQGEAFAGDILLFEVGAGEPTKHGFRIYYRVTKIKNGTQIALVENGMVCYDYQSNKIQALPEAVRKICVN